MHSRFGRSKSSKRKNPPWCVRTIYCDESGATGNDLLDPNQEYFVYASVALEPNEAKDLTSLIQLKYNLQGKELKGRNLLGHPSGRQAVDHLIEAVSNRAHLVIHHKKFALAAKFFEYMFEPVLASGSSAFYAVGFHKFISNLLYVWALAQDKTADEILGDFARAMRSLGPPTLPIFLGTGPSLVHIQNPLHQIGTFCLIHNRKITKEISELHETEHGKWILDLTTTSLFSILGH